MAWCSRAPWLLALTLTSSEAFRFLEDTSRNTSRNASRNTSHKVKSDNFKFAVVRPFWKDELESLHSTISCKHIPPSVDLVLYYAGRATDNASANATVGVFLNDLAKVHKCIRVQYADIHPTVGYPAAPCTQFVQQFLQKLPLWGYHAIYLMELDVVPVRQRWVQEILPLLHEAATGKVWVVGGVYNLGCMVTPSGQTLYSSELKKGVNRSQIENGSAWWNNRHINGNGVYSAHPGFVDWIEKEYGSRRGGAGAPYDRCKVQGGYDEVMFLDARKGPAGRWREDNRFMDCKPVGIFSNAETMKISRIGKLFPEAVLVHASAAVKNATTKKKNHLQLYIRF